MQLPYFTENDVLPVGDHSLTLDELRECHLVTGEGNPSKTWDAGWRLQLVKNLEVMVVQLWAVGVVNIFVNGSFCENKDHPHDIDGYFEVDRERMLKGSLETELNDIDPFRVWTWNRASRTWDPNSAKRQLPMWHRYRVELYPHFPGLLSGIRDRHGNELKFPSAFRRRRGDDLPKGIIKMVKTSVADGEENE
jgi:hypothetical protein